ncbi:two-component system, NtrC family, nitrogen regulation sensor histidine kinase NtrY [Methylomarinovum caldicuralii]|uniref:histidine kinase n=1 Tax=Methylomarinovum caldicuralii TaxID=438856 RepID=A0AAU9CH98_9GAMM|nr:ATP-binding protein [Methylomarinovum caldicuralii]BCX82370.1 two-component system, NtrC family, nitrogen regulation sensor histidine kinase NtrY [Methylomarinovum caldicuralii]
MKIPLSLGLVALFAIILVPLHLMSSATQAASELNRWYSWLLLINVVGSLLLLGLVAANLWWLVRQFRRRAAGSRLALRMMLLFVFLALTPATIVFYYSFQFLHRSIDSWFDVEIDRAMDSSLELSKAALAQRMRTLLERTRHLGEALAQVPEEVRIIELDRLRARSDAAELTLLTRQGRIVAVSSGSADLILPSLPDISLLTLARDFGYVGLDPAPGPVADRKATSLLQIRVLVPVDLDAPYFLQALYPLPARLNELAHTVEQAYAHYQQMVYLRRSLKFSFSLTLALILSLSMLAAIWAAFLSIRRIVAPVKMLVQGTRAVAQGNLDKRLPILQKDDMGFLVSSFNTMTAHLARARDEAERSRREVEDQRAYLETVLGHLSSGVLTLNEQTRLNTANQAAQKILGIDFQTVRGQPLRALGEANPALKDLVRRIRDHLLERDGVWQEEIHLDTGHGQKVLLCRGSCLLGADGRRLGAVLVFDDITALVQAQKHAAWSEMARRLAHEIKNPLTPIQLAAERLQHKLGPQVDERGGQVLERSTRTIVQQVEALKDMVNAFSEYARLPKLKRQPVDLGILIDEVVTLYPPTSGVEIDVDLSPELPVLQADPLRLRQVLHNLIKNALEAGQPPVHVEIGARVTESQGQPWLEWWVSDNGPGIAPQRAQQIFDPYVTTKSKGTGLGLAIVRKIIEEHGGSIQLDPAWRQGARFIIRLPIATANQEHSHA